MQKQPSQMDYARQGLDVTKAQIDLFKNSPDSSKPLVNALNDFQKRNEKYKPVEHAAIDGLVGAIKYNAENKELTKGQQIEATLAEGLRSFQRLAAFKRQEAAEREALAPYASAAIKLAYSGADSDTINNNARTLFEMAADKGLVKGRFVSMAPNSTVAVIKNDDGSLNAFDISSIDPEGAKLAQDERRNNLSLGIQQQNANAYSRSVQNSLDIRNDQIEAQKEAKALQAQQKELKDLEAAFKEYEVYDSAEKLLYAQDENGNILMNKDGSPQLSDRALQGKYSQGLFSETPNIFKNKDQALFGTLASDAKGRHFKQMGYRNETEYKNIRTIDPRLSPEANLEITKSQKERLAPYVQRYQELKNNLSGTGQQGNVPQGNQPNMEDSNTIEVVSPDGVSGRIPKANLKTALEQGFDLVY